MSHTKTTAPSDDAMRPRRVKVSQQMQVRIPAEFFKRYGFGDEAVCVPTATGVEYRPVRSALDQTCDILDELVGEGVSGPELSQRFRERAEQALRQSIDLDGTRVDVSRVDLRDDEAR